jgi:biotin carboxylase
MRRVVLLCPTSREYRDVPRLASELGCEVVFDDFDGGYFDRVVLKDYAGPCLEIVPLIESAIEKYSGSGISGITSAVGYPGMSVVSIMAERLGLSGPEPDCILRCEHKYYARVAQQMLVPEATPEFHLIDPSKPEHRAAVARFPVFLKPVKSCMSMSAHKVYNETELEKYVRSSLLPEGFLKPFNDMLRQYSGFEQDVSCLLVESLLEGSQVSLEGYVFGGRVHVMGIIDAIMFPGTYSFKRFQYPSSLSQDVQSRMVRIAERFISGIGYDNALFNIEMIYNARTDQIHIIEVNPKIASQFPDLFEKVDGTSSYTVLLQVALGQEPAFQRRQGRFKVASSCVLRTFEDHEVISVPSPSQIEAVTRRFPDARIQILASPGRRLSDQMQDVSSYRYGLVNIGADSEAKLEEKFEICKSLLAFEFAPVRPQPHALQPALPA